MAFVLNPTYVEPVSNTPGFSIKIYASGVGYEFCKFYNPPSMEIEENRGFERGSCRFDITDWTPNEFNMPFIPQIDQQIKVSNYSENDDFFVGRIAEVESRMVHRRDNGTEVMVYSITCTDLTIDFERFYLSERYEGVTTGFIARDVIKRYTFFDYSLIDPLEGQIVTDLRFSQETVSTVLQRVLEIEPTWTFWFNPTTKEVYIGEAASIYNTVLYITETNVYDVFNPPTFMLTPDNSIVRNRVKFFYNQRYNTGTVSITEGDTILFGQGTQFLDFVKEGATVRINNGDAIYSIQRVLTNTELVLSSAYQETTIITGEPYEIIGSPGLIVVSDATSIAAMALINGETTGNPLLRGVYEYKVPNDSNPYTYTEAMEIAKAHLLRYSVPLISGEGDSDNYRIDLRQLHAGQSIEFNLPTSRQVVASVIIQQLVKKDTGALLPRIDTTAGEDRIDPLMEYRFDFKDRIYDSRNQLKRLQIDIRRTTIDGDLIVFHNRQIPEYIYVSDEVTVTPGTTFEEEIEITDSIDLRSPPDSPPYYTQPTAQLEGFVIGRSQWGFTA